MAMGTTTKADRANVMGEATTQATNRRNSVSPSHRLPTSIFRLRQPLLCLTYGCLGQQPRTFHPLRFASDARAPTAPQNGLDRRPSPRHHFHPYLSWSSESLAVILAWLSTCSSFASVPAPAWLILSPRWTRDRENDGSPGYT